MTENTADGSTDVAQCSTYGHALHCFRSPFINDQYCVSEDEFAVYNQGKLYLQQYVTIYSTAG